ncbi:phosphotyrosine protein phosphatase I superfamily [Aspergillus cavernicola]|uniref:Phosphotyrosine protein phosphatase I superfamily n=1 Tax=Aspergillus cavernicola TaxID=176166 RepID=A0ABR4HV00_9EURO
MTTTNNVNSQTINVLFVCLGNICRSPMAEGVFRNISATHPLINVIDSAGTAAYHAGQSSDSRTMDTLRRHNIRNYSHAARKVTLDDFLQFDYLFAMDESNLEDLLELRASILAGSSKTAASGNRAARSRGTRAANAASIAASVGAGAKVAEVRLFGDYGPGGALHENVGGGEVVQDPYYGGVNGFEEVYQQVVRFSKNFIDYIEKKHQD